jgi:site-specific DNA-methyltransferase (adenine-specific)
MGDGTERRRARSGTTTSAFGVSRRESHDASDFYARFSAPEVSDDEAIAGERAIDTIVCGDARSMDAVPDASVALVVTSPPYFAGKEYEEALGEGHVPANYLEYLAMLRDVFAECVRTLEPGGRIAVNVANLGRRPYRSLSADVIGILQDDLHLLLRGEVIWQKARGSAGSCAWGSFQRPTNPVLRDLTERVVIASKGRFDRALSPKEREDRGLPSGTSLSRDEFMEATTDVWEIPSEMARRVGHPAPFPVELPSRLIHLYTHPGDLVLDPFMGSGTSAVAAIRTGRHFVGYDTDSAYVERAQERAARELERQRREAARNGTEVEPPRLTAKDVAAALLADAGFADIDKTVKLPAGLDIAMSARDRAGDLWYFDVAGGFTTTRPGLKRADTLWRAIGKAAVLHALEPDARLVVLTAEAPPAQSSSRKALAAVTGPGQPLRAVIELAAGDVYERLAELAAGSRPA